jgi:cell division protein FtsA
VVLTGGGAMLDGAIDLAESVFKLPVRLGKPAGVTGLTDMVKSPMYATGVGLVLYGANQDRKHKPKGFSIRDKNIFYKVMAQMKRWFKEVI